MKCIETVSSHRRQIAFVTVVASCMMIEGQFMTWPNVIVHLFQGNYSSTTTNFSAPTTQLLLTDYEAGLLACLPTISSLPFILLSGLCVKLVGLKGSSALGTVLAITAWLLMGFAPSKAALFAGRAVSGASYAFIATVSQPLVSELVSPKIRGVVASLPKFLSNLGGLWISVADIFLPWNLTTALCAAPFVVIFFSIMLVPESPYWLVKKGRKEAARSALRLLNSSADDVEEHLKEVEKCVTEDSKEAGVMEQMRQMRHSTNYKPVLLMAILFACYGSNGTSIVSPYSTMLFSMAGMPLDPRLCTVLLVLVRLASLIIGAFVTDLCGRRPLYIGTSISSVLTLALTSFSLTFPLIPKEFLVIFLMCFVISSSVGCNLVPPILLGEMIPLAVQSVGCSLCIVLDTIAYGTFLFATPWLTETISLRFVFLIPAGINLLGAFTAWRWLPETKKRSLFELQRAFA